MHIRLLLFVLLIIVVVWALCCKKKEECEDNAPRYRPQKRQGDLPSSFLLDPREFKKLLDRAPNMTSEERASLLQDSYELKDNLVEFAEKFNRMNGKGCGCEEEEDRSKSYVQVED